MKTLTPLPELQPATPHSGPWGMGAMSVSVQLSSVTALSDSQAVPCHGAVSVESLFPMELSTTQEKALNTQLRFVV